MRKLILTVVLLTLVSLSQAQLGTTSSVRNGSNLPTTCAGGDIFIKSGSSSGFYYNVALGTCSFSAVAANPTIYRECAIDITDNNTAPQLTACQFPQDSTVVQIDIRATSGTPSIIISKNHGGTQTALLSTDLATGSAGAIACSNTDGTTGLDTATTCSATLQNTDIAAGDWIDVTAWTPGGTGISATAVVHVSTLPSSPPAPSVTPAVLQTFTCGASSPTSASCPSSIATTEGSYLIITATGTDNGCGTVTSSLGNTFTLQVSNAYYGFYTYWTCIYSAPVTVAGSDTITVPVGGTGANAARVYEVSNIGTTGIVTAVGGNNSPPVVMTATAPADNSFLICVTPNGSATTSESYTIDHLIIGSVGLTSAYGNVSAGSQSCTFSAGVGAAMAIFPNE